MPLSIRASTSMESDEIYRQARHIVDQLCEDLKLAISESLTPREKDYLSGLLCGDKPEQIAKRFSVVGITVRTTLSKAVYPRISQFLERRFGRAVKISHWSEVASLLSKAGYGVSSTTFQPATESEKLAEWDEVPEVTTFYGREDDLKKLVGSCGSSCRVMVISGQPGVGKTTLAAAFARQMRSHFERVVWRSLRDTPALSTLLSELTSNLGASAQAVDHISIEAQISGLIRCLQQSRTLLVLDNADGMFEDGSVLRTYRSGYQDYALLFKRLVEVKHNSYVVLTGWENPNELQLQGGKSSPVQTLTLKGLKNDAQKILEDYELSGQTHWDSLIKLYRGNPYSLKVVAVHILEMFGGDVQEFWSEHTTYLGEISNLLHVQFLRLSELEILIVKYLAEQAGRLVTREELQERFNVTGSRSPVNEAIAALKRRSLIEEDKENGINGYDLPPVVLKYVRSQNV